MSPLGLFRRDFCFGVGEAHASCWCARRPPSRGNQLLSVSALPNPCHTAHGWGPHPSPRFPLITRTWLPSVFISADSLPGRRIWPCFPSPPAVTTVPKARRARAALPSVPPRSGRPRSRLGACALALACRARPAGRRGGWGFPRRPHPSPSSCLSRVWRPLSCLSPRVSPLCARSQPDPPYLSRTFTLITSSRLYK